MGSGTRLVSGEYRVHIPAEDNVYDRHQSGPKLLLRVMGLEAPLLP